MSTWWMTSSIMHSCDESDDSLRITSVEVEVQKVIELVDDGYKMRFRHIQVCSTGIRAYGNRN